MTLAIDPGLQSLDRIEKEGSPFRFVVPSTLTRGRGACSLLIGEDGAI